MPFSVKQYTRRSVFKKTLFVSSQVFASSIHRCEPPAIAAPVRELREAMRARFRALSNPTCTG